MQSVVIAWGTHGLKLFLFQLTNHPVVADQDLGVIMHGARSILNIYIKRYLDAQGGISSFPVRQTNSFTGSLHDCRRREFMIADADELLCL